MLMCMQMHTFALLLRLTLCRNSSCQDVGKVKELQSMPIWIAFFVLTCILAAVVMAQGEAMC